VWRWPAVFSLFKVSLFPFALIGWRDRRWWVAGSVAFLPFCWLLPSYAQALKLFDGGIDYSLGEVPVLSIPIIAWVASRHRPSRVIRLSRFDAALSERSA
jgi:hypothetical protein